MKTPYKRPSSIVTCAECNIKFEKENREIKKTNNKKSAHLCSRQCVGKYAMNILHGPKNKMKHYLKSARQRAKQKDFEFN